MEHDRDRWGAARADDAERSRLVRVGDLVEALARVDERATADAARIVLDRLGSAALFELRSEGDARQVDEQWRHRPVSRLFVDLNDSPGPNDPSWHKGPSGARELMRLAWCKGGAARLNLGAAEWLAVLQTVAVATFPELDWPTEAIAAAPTVSGSAPQVVQPEGGTWPHLDGQAWTEAERAALFLMRHRDGWAGERLAAVAGVKRQRIDELIGAARPHGGPAAARGADGWAPSPALLAACGKPLQPLQRAAVAMTG